jgi:hydroxymethylpyrimidine/phosphomethylpyrimidine kinase
MKTALTVAGSDSIGGAGIQADVKAMSSVGVHAATVLTAVTAQNTRRVGRIYPLPADFIQEQLDSVLSDCKVEAVKTGMLYSAEIVEVITDVFEDHSVPLVVDPVMVATVGDSLSKGDLAGALKSKLIPICELVTPNKAEAEVLSGMKIYDEDDAMLACEIIGKQGSSVLLKGGHMDTKNIIDYLYLSSEFTIMKNPRLSNAGHGSGCALSALIAANIAKGADLVNAVIKSRQSIQNAISTQYAIGRGEVVVNMLAGNIDNNEKFNILEELESVSDKIVDILPHELIPVNGSNIAFAKSDAAGPEDVAAIEGKITVHNGILKRNGPARFGAADHLSYVILEVMKKYPDVRCIMDISPAEDTVDIMEEIGLTVAKFNRTGGNQTWAALTKEAVSKKREAPDAIIDADHKKKSKIIKIIGKTPSDVLSKLESILD